MTRRKSRGATLGLGESSERIAVVFQQFADKQIQQMLTLIDNALAAPRLRLRFDELLETQFEIETSAARSRMLVRQGIAAVLIYNALLVLDFFALSDVFWLAVVVRVGLFGSVMAVMLAVIWRNPPARVREGLLAVSALVAGAGVLILVLASSSQMRSNYHDGIMLVMLFVIALQHLRFSYAVPTTFGLMILHAAAVLAVDTITVQDKLAAIALTQALAGFALYADFTFEKNERHMWLRAFRDRLRAAVFEELAAADPMTGLGNRRAMEQWLGQLRGDRQGATISIVVVDIDYFKSYNDTFGHMQGDDCIRRIADILTDEARADDGRVFRFGGEEFVVVLVGREPEQTYAIAERMRLAVCAAGLPHKTKIGSGHVTCSFGFAIDTLVPDADLTALLTEADFSLYAAKKAGRNCVMPKPEDDDEFEVLDLDELLRDVG